MQGNCTNCYQKARVSAGLTQEKAAELLDVSVRALADYETGIRTPPAARVADMAEVYRTPWLRLEHARATDELGIIPPAAQPRSFPLAAMQFYNYLIEWSQKRRGQQLLKIAEDGVIDEEERPLYDEIVCELEGIAAALLSLMCAEGAKKERPDVGASKRSCSPEIRKPENHHSAIINGFPAERKHFFAGEGVTSL